MSIDRIRGAVWIVSLAAACGGEIGGSVGASEPLGAGPGGPGAMEDSPTDSGGASQKATEACESHCALRAECSDVSAELCLGDCLETIDEDSPGACSDTRIALYACLGAQDSCAALESGEGCVAEADAQRSACH